MKKIYIKCKRAVRFLFYRELNINEQNEINKYLHDENILKLFWKMSKADRQHSYEVFKRSKSKKNDMDLLVLSLLHDIGKSKIHANLFFRIFSELGLIKSKKSQYYIDHETIGLDLLKDNKIDKNIIEYYTNNLLKQKHNILEITDY